MSRVLVDACAAISCVVLACPPAAVSSAPAAVVDAAPPSAASPPPSVPEMTMKDDVLLVIGGNFSVDHLGPQRFDEVRARVRQRSVECLDTLHALVASAPAEALSMWWASVLLELTRPSAPDRSLAEARVTARAYEAAERPLRSVTTPEDRERLERLDQRRAELDALIKGWTP